jgi:hypothetical protein
LAALIERRHQIVHRADRVDAPENPLGVLRPIDSLTVLTWAENVMFFIATVLNSSAAQLLVNQGVIEKRGDRFFRTKDRWDRQEKADQNVDQTMPKHALY